MDFLSFDSKSFHHAAFNFLTMDSYDLEEIVVKPIKPNFHLNVSLGLIRYMGTWPPEGKLRPLYFIFTVISFTFFLGNFLACEIAHVLVHWGDVAQIFAVASILMTNLVHAYKYIIILCRQYRIRALLNVVYSEIFNRYNAKYENVISLYTRRGIFHHIMYQTFGGIAVFCWGFTPITDLIAGRSRRLPMEGWYPYNVTKSPAFEVTAAHQAIGVTIACINNVAIDTLVNGLITVACCQLTILKWNMATAYKNMSHIVAHNEYRDFVHHHNKIFEFAKETQSIFGTAIFFQCLVNCIIVCLIAFNISQLKIYIPSVVIGMTMYLCCMIYQIFIYCWHGNELNLHSSSVIFGCYSSNWWYGMQNFKNSLKFIMMRVQRPIVFTAGNIMTLSLHTFVAILRMSYSIFTVLQSTTND